MSSTAEPLGFSLTGALLGGAMVPGGHGWVAVLSGPVGFLAPGGNCVCNYTSICNKGVKQQYFLLDLG